MSTSSDPRQSESIIKYVPEVRPIEEDDPDVAGFVALVVGVIGLMLKNRLATWISLVFATESYLNQRQTEPGIMGSPSATIIFAVSTLLMSYLPEVVAFITGVPIGASPVL